MRTFIAATQNLTKMDCIRVSGASSLMEVTGTLITIAKAAITESPDNNGELVRAYVIIDTEGNIYSGKSPTVVAQMQEIIDYIDEENDFITMKVCSRKSKAGKEFLILM